MKLTVNPYKDMDETITKHKRKINLNPISIGRLDARVVWTSPVLLLCANAVGVRNSKESDLL